MNCASSYNSRNKDVRLGGFKIVFSLYIKECNPSILNFNQNLNLLQIAATCFGYTNVAIIRLYTRRKSKVSKVK